MNTDIILKIMQIILAFANICIISYGFYKFLARPHDSLEERVSKLEKRVDKIEDEHSEDNELQQKQLETNEVIQKSLLALIEFEIQYCTAEGKGISPELQKARDELHNYLARK